MKYLIIFTFISYPIFSHDFYISDEKFEFIYVQEKLVSKNCEKACLAIKAKVSRDDISLFDKKGGKNPATQACKSSGGEIVEAKSKLEHKTFFCKFSDNSYIHSGHLL